MDPKSQDCVGLYLYGAGYYARDQNTIGLLTGNEAPPHFCLTCVARARCEDEHEKRVRELRPAAAEEFDRRMAQAVRRGIGPTLAAMYLGKQGLDPYALEAVENFKRGHADRGVVAGPLVK